MKNLSHYIKVYDDVFTKDFCSSLITRFETLDSATSPSIRLSDHSWDKDYRRFTEVNIKEDPAFTDLIDPYYARIQEVYAHYKQMVGGEFFPSKFSLEEARMKRYLNDDYEQSRRKC